jgi:four helix bundle protein
MGKVKKFEDLIAWQKSKVLAIEIYRATSEGSFARDFGLRDQIRRASVSIISNIAEGYERGSAKEFHRSLTIAKASCAEVRSQLYIAFELNYLTQTHFEKLFALAQESARIIGGLRSAVYR